MSDRIEIKKTSKLGSLKETINFVKKIKKETSSYNRILLKESARFLINAIRARKYIKRVKDCIKKNETIILSPIFVINEHKYNVIRYGPSFVSVLPLKNIPTGYTVIDHNHNIVYNLDYCKKICKLYNIWETFYFLPIKSLRVKALIQWETEFKKNIFNDIIYRRNSKYQKLDMSKDEILVLKELDEQVYQFHEFDMELLKIEENLNDLQFELFEKPSETIINELIQILTRFNELMPIEKQYIEKRINTWKIYNNLLEKKYKIKVNFNFNMTDIGLAAFIDLMKYILTNRIIPEAVLTRLSIQAIKDVGEAKISEALLNLIVHYGGLTSLEKQMQNHDSIVSNIKQYFKIWETDIPNNMIRLP